MTYQNVFCICNVHCIEVLGLQNCNWYYPLWYYCSCIYYKYDMRHFHVYLKSIFVNVSDCRWWNRLNGLQFQSLTKTTSILIYHWTRWKCIQFVIFIIYITSYAPVRSIPGPANVYDIKGITSDILVNDFNDCKTHWVQTKRHSLWFLTKSCSCYSAKT